MPKKRKILNIDEKCRICLKDDGCMSYMFSDDLKPKIDDLAECTSIHIDDDENFPNNICHICLYKLEMWVDFKKQFVCSDKMLREHLEYQIPVDDDTKTKRKCYEKQESVKECPSEQPSTEKLKSALPNTVSTDSVPTIEMKTQNITNRTKSTSDEDCAIIKKEQKKNSNDSPQNESKLQSENTSDMVTITSSVCGKIKQTSGRRVKTTERRKASTKRWVARKKALLAATGENDSDTDSMSSDDPDLSPDQKTRVKCNTEKIVEAQRRITRTLQNLKSNVSGYHETKPGSDNYIIGDTDSDVNKNKASITKTDAVIIDGNGDDGLADNNVNSNTTVATITKNSVVSLIGANETNSSTISDDVPHIVKSELIIDDATFIVTSTLIVAETLKLNQKHLNNSSTDGTGLPTDDVNSQEQNTDIIDAVQLRRVTPRSSLDNEKKYVERCLNIEIEGTELDALQRVQTELATFVENDMKDKLLNDNVIQDNDKCDAKPKDSFQALEKQLKTIVEKAIKKNLDSLKNKKTLNTTNSKGNNTFTSPFVKAAMRSKIFQPRVIVTRLDMNRIKSMSENRKVGNASNFVNNRSSSSQRRSGPLSVTLGKRQSVRPARFAAYTTGSIHSDESDSAPDVPEKNETPVAAPASVHTDIPKTSKVKTYGPAFTKQGQVTSSIQREQHSQRIRETVKREAAEKYVVTDTNRSLLLVTRSADTHQNNTVTLSTAATNNSTCEKHICGFCGELFGTQNEVEIHFRAHKTSTETHKGKDSVKQPKQKMMRCKRCHEIVEACNVKLHVCHLSKILHKCYVCDASFRGEKLLAKHLEEHNLDAECKIERIQNPQVKNIPETAAVEESTKLASPAATSTNVVQAYTKESYTCFVCDKTFTDEEILKDHLQKHCDDISEDEQNNGKEQYQCAICGESLESEDSLENHVEKHLFDDEDDNPNLISIGEVDNDAMSKDATQHVCGQCSERFDSEMLLMLHMQAHEEEVAIAEWERRGIENARDEQHMCVICDEVFATEDELCEHLDMHNENSHTCMLCDKPFLTLKELQNHVNTH